LSAHKQVIDAQGVHYRQLNEKIRQAIAVGAKEIEITGVNGQRYIGDGLHDKVLISLDGVPGNDLAAFMDGPTIDVKNNAQDGVGNTMNDGKVIIHGHAGDVLGYGMRGGKLHILGDVGYRVGIHMKSYQKKIPSIVVGGKAGDFFGEYMAGGNLILLGLNNNTDDKPITGNYTGTGMHGGTIYIRGTVDEYQLGAEVGIKEPDNDDQQLLNGLLGEFCADFGLNLETILQKPFIKLVPISHRPYGKLYAY
jgi:glutamate synthase domain-containing protein 3